MIRLVRFDADETGLLVGTGTEAVVVDVSASLGALSPAAAEAIAPFVAPGASWAGLIAAWGIHRGAVARLNDLAESGTTARLLLRPVDTVTLRPPLPEPAARIFAMGGNFPMHLAGAVAKLDLPDSVKQGTKADTPPWGFFVIPHTTVGPEAEVAPPPATRHFDYEAEVGAVLTGEPVRDDGRVPIFGYTAWNDFSIRDPAFKLTKVDHGPLTWSLQKNFDTANACGPCLVVDGGADVEAVRIICRVNDEVRQDGTTADMNYKFGEIAAHISEYLTLRPGDMILSGTPSGTAMEGGPEGRFLQDGDVTEVEVDGVGVLRNRVRLGGAS
jgi:2-keto-4-pentenoate hydratase/2-oxohepta-3-ene-1,7-dioic acid hydratase in catechol pathway